MNIYTYNQMQVLHTHSHIYTYVFSQPLFYKNDMTQGQFK